MSPETQLSASIRDIGGIAVGFASVIDIFLQTEVLFSNSNDYFFYL
jgi:hypothetical protein